MSDTERVSIWSNGTAYLIWQENNCQKCIKQGDCELEFEIDLSRIGDGDFAPEVAARLGYAGEPWFWCSERRTEEEGPTPAATEMARAGAKPLPLFDMGWLP